MLVQLLSLKKKVGTPEGLMEWKLSRVPLKVGSYRGVGLRLLCRSQSLLRPLTSERSTEGPVAKNGVCVSVWPPMGCAPEKTQVGVFVKQWAGIKSTLFDSF